VSAHELVHTVRAIARAEVERLWYPALGVVTSVHGGTEEHACTVRLRETALVLPKVPIATGLIGSAALPSEGDLVLVVFENGDLHAPICVGRLYDDEVSPPDHGPGELIAFLPGGEDDESKALQVALRTPGDGSRSLKVTLGGTVEVELEVSDGTVRLRAQDAKLELTQSGASDGKASLEVGGSSITIEESGDVSVQASGKLTLKATQIEISGDATVKVAGQTIDLN
jgi:uncharacterized protein involved in type VI secretion and phage assembly